MADIVDNGNDAAELHLRAALTNRQQCGPRATGKCLNCQQPTDGERRWCDADCRDQWQEDQDRLKRGW